MRKSARQLDVLLAALLLAAATACGSTPAATPASDIQVSADADASSGQNDAAAADSTAADAATPDVTGTDVAATDASAADATQDAAVADSAVADSAADTATLDAAADVPSVDAQPADAQSADTAPADAVASAVVAGNLVEAGWSFGECMKGCNGNMKLQGASLELTITDIDGTVSHMAKGILTTGAAAELENLLNPLVGKSLPLVSGCPDCADGGAAYVVFSDGKATSKHTYEYGKPPAALAGLDKMMAAAMAGLKSCKGDETVVILGACPMDLP